MRRTATVPTALCALGAVSGVLGCGDIPIACPVGCDTAPTTIAMDFAPDAGFYEAPFPDDARLGTDGRAAVDGFPNPSGVDLVARVIDVVRTGPQGFGATSAIFFRATAPLRGDDLPDVRRSVDSDSPVALVSLDGPERLRRWPLSTAFLRDGGPFGAPDLIALLPQQGVVLRPDTRYAAVVLRELLDEHDRPLGVAPAVATLASGGRPAGMSDAVAAEHRDALAALAESGIASDRVAGFAVFTTGSATGELDAVVDAMRAAPPTQDGAWVPKEIFDAYCVYETTIAMPVYQRGDPPYASAGGDWVFEADGQPVWQRDETARFVVTIPRMPMPSTGYPIVILSRSGAGGERPLVDRGPHATAEGPSVEAGAGPALSFARAGFAGSSIDGPHGGLRNVTDGDEQFLMFNIGNPRALRDNVRQSAAELALELDVLGATTVDVSGCPGAVAPGAQATFDITTSALMGHSMGATIAPLTMAVEPRLGALLLSGAGGSWIENVVHKQEPIAVKAIAEVLVGLAGTGYELSEHDPLLSLFQWAGESADPPLYADRVLVRSDGPARHVLMIQGIVDHYILPPIANAATLSLGLDVAGEELDSTTAELAPYSPIGELLPLVGRRAVPLPVGANVDTPHGPVTAVVVQHREDGIEDGHEVVFQADAPKREIVCFLSGLARGAPRVPSPGGSRSPCD